MVSANKTQVAFLRVFGMKWKGIEGLEGSCVFEAGFFLDVFSCNILCLGVFYGEIRVCSQVCSSVFAPCLLMCFLVSVWSAVNGGKFFD
jgi:hypothetical protein